MIPNATKRRYLDGSIDLSNDTVRVALYDDSISYDFDPDAHEFVGDILDDATAAEMSGTGYQRVTVSNPTTSQDDTNDRAILDGDDLLWEDLDAGTIQGLVAFVERSDDTDSPVLFVIDDGDMGDLPLDTNGSDVMLEWDDVGIKTLS